MTKQFELFNSDDYTSPYEWGVTNRSTRRKTPPKRKTIVPAKETITFQTSQTINTI